MAINADHTTYAHMSNEQLVSHTDTVLDAAEQYARHVDGTLPEWVFVVKALRDRLDAVPSTEGKIVISEDEHQILRQDQALLREYRYSTRDALDMD